MAKQQMAIVGSQRIPIQTAKGGRSVARVKGLIRYLTYGHYIQDQNERAQERGVWFGPKRAYNYQEVLDWAKGSVHASEQPYGYTLLLSTRDGDLAEWEYEQALWAGNEWVEVTDWRLVVHEDTANQHAHALVFPREVIPTNLLHEWAHFHAGGPDASAD